MDIYDEIGLGMPIPMRPTENALEFPWRIPNSMRLHPSPRSLESEDMPKNIPWSSISPVKHLLKLSFLPGKKAGFEATWLQDDVRQAHPQLGAHLVLWAPVPVEC